MGTFGITDFDSSSALCKDGTIDKNNPSNPCINNGGVNWGGGARPLHYGNIMKELNKNIGFPDQSNVSSTLPQRGDSVTCADGTKDKVGGAEAPCTTRGGVSPNQDVQKPRTFLEKNQTMLIGIGVPVGFYAFSKYQKYDSKKTLKVTIIGLVIVLGAIVINGLSGMWSGNTIAKSIFGKQNAPKQLGGKPV